jgi:hypothetical protein
LRLCYGCTAYVADKVALLLMVLDFGCCFVLLQLLLVLCVCLQDGGRILVDSLLTCGVSERTTALVTCGVAAPIAVGIIVFGCARER